MVVEKGFKYTGFFSEFQLIDNRIIAPINRGESKKITIESGITAENTYMEFVSINISDDNEILKFYNKYGLLKNEIGSSSTESIEIFKNEVLRMQAIIELKQAIDENSNSNLIQSAGKLIKTYKQPEDLIYMIDGRFPVIVEYQIQHLLKRIDGLLSDNEIDIFEKNEYTIFNLCGLLIDRVVNEYLETIQPNLVFNILDNVHRGEWRVKTLLSAMYFELFLRFSQNKKIRKCMNSTCRGYFEIVGNDTRKIYCNAYCASLEAKRKERRRKAELKKKESE